MESRLVLLGLKTKSWEAETSETGRASNLKHTRVSGSLKMSSLAAVWRK